MRSSKSRSRNKNNRNNRPSGGNIINRVFDSSGPDGKVRGTPQQIIEKYLQLHRDAQLAGDRVNAENFAQHAEHYLRMLAEAQKEIDKQREEQEAANRERQAERDRERQHRFRDQEGGAPADDQPETEDDGSTFGARPDLVPAFLNAPQEPEEEPSGLVETPEAAAEAAAPVRRPRRPRKPREEVAAEGGGPAEAAE